MCSSDCTIHQCIIRNDLIQGILIVFFLKMIILNCTNEDTGCLIVSSEAASLTPQKSGITKIVRIIDNALIPIAQAPMTISPFR